ncbi:PRC-barrel domain-containing protein [Hydrogenophaga sp.]|uniref:PRC-barrel domain-containing protein n=1 Tax=Hydrogenophaga sp. TaxID=1904254 RepID=UPI0025C5AD42|nr:PRC-barrel domain-containing protein [Hydrogenophaga sp.]
MKKPTNMLCITQDLLSLAIVATDSTSGGPIGEVKDLCFDDAAWAIRHLVVKTGSWLSGHQVLISPMAAGKPDWTDKWLPTPLGRAQFEKRPDIDPAMTLTQPQETGRIGVDSRPHGWKGLGGWNGEEHRATGLPGEVGGGPATATREAPDTAPFRTVPGEHHTVPQLRSGKAMVGYHIQATDGEVGQVRDMLVDDANWSIRYLLVSNNSWWLGHDVLLAPAWVQHVDCVERCITVKMSRDALKQALWYDAKMPLTREMEIAVYQNHGRSGYWTDEAQPPTCDALNRNDA